MRQARDLLGTVGTRVGVGAGVEQAGVAAEGAQELGGGSGAVEEVRWGAVGAGVLDEQDHPVRSVEQVGAGLGQGLGWRLTQPALFLTLAQPPPAERSARAISATARSSSNQWKAWAAKIRVARIEGTTACW